MPAEIASPPALQRRRRRYSIGIALDWFFFVVAGVASVWLAYLSLTESFTVGWWGIPLVVLFWVLLAYLVLPRLHRILTTIYVPDYFIGRARTSDGLLGDPINLAVLGEEQQLHVALDSAGWTRADPVTVRSSLRIIASTLTGRSYDEAPVSPLFLFGRQQDFAYQQEVDGNPRQRHHVRFWRCPDDWPLPGGRRVDWLAAGTFDTRVGLSLFTLQVTHKIDSDTDVERDHILRAFVAADPRISVERIVDFSSGYHARNGGGDTIRTDGDLPIIDVRAVGTSDPAGATDDSTVMSGAVAAPARREPESALMRHTRPSVKRPAFESPARLLTAVPHDPDMKRPATIVAGAGLVLLRVLAGALVLVGIALAWRELAADASLVIDDAILSPAQIHGSLPVLLGVGVAVLVIDLALGALVFYGHNLARVILMILAVLSISTSFVAWWAGGEKITVQTTLLALALDILVLLALSARSAAAFAHRKEHDGSSARRLPC